MKVRLSFVVIMFLASVVFGGTPSSAQQLTTLYDFCSLTNCTDGAMPQGYPIQDSDGNFYAVTSGGGEHGQGTIFQMTSTGGLTTLYSFCSVGDYCTDGAQPYSGVIEGSDGNFYGTTVGGGIAQTYDLCGGATAIGPPPMYTCGTVFKLNPTTGQLTTLYTFCSQLVTINSNLFCGDGSNPLGGLVEDSAGNFYGTTPRGGTSGQGTGIVYELSPEPAGGCAAGSNPGNGYCENLLSNFCLSSGCGAGPGGLIQGSDGNFYGVTGSGWGEPGANGTVFEITPGGAMTTLYDFCSAHACADGGGPNPNLVEDSAGNFYGTTSLYGNTGGPGGTIFKLFIEPASGCPSGSNTGNGWCETTLHPFCSLADCADGYAPYFGLIQGSDGNLYGMTYYGDGPESECVPGVYGCGTIFNISPTTGTFNTLYDFCTAGTAPDCPDGALPFAALVQGKDYNFYGLAAGGPPAAGNIGEGIFFRLVVLPIGSFSPASLSFGTHDLGTSSAKNVTLTNTGQQPLIVSGIAPSGDFSEKNNCGTIAVGAACTIRVTFTPSQIGTRTGTLTITDNDGGVTGNLQAVPLTGTGANPAVTLSADSLSFGNQAIDTTSNAQKITLTSSGTTSLESISITIVGPNASDFRQTSDCPATLKPNAKCVISVTFTPSLLAAESATLQVSDNAVNSPQTVALTGTGEVQATLTPASFTFPKTKVGDTSTGHKFTLKNNLSTTLTGISYSTAAPFAILSSTCGTTLNSNATCAIVVTFSPTETGTATGTLTVSDSANNTPQTASLAGTGD